MNECRQAGAPAVDDRGEVEVGNHHLGARVAQQPLELGRHQPPVERHADEAGLANAVGLDVL